ncbi:universal stress protein [Bacteroidota bacterium]
MKVKKIIVPIDFSDVSHFAADYALFLAKNYNAQITLLHVIELYRADVGEEEHLMDFEKYLEKKERARVKRLKLKQAAAVKSGIDIDAKILRGFSAADTILDYIEENRNDLVVMGTRGRTGLSKWVFGSVATKIVRESNVPVITVKTKQKRATLSKIMVPVDFSEFSKLAIIEAKKIAKKFGTELHFIHCVEQHSHPEFYFISDEKILIANSQLNGLILRNLKKYAGKNVEKAKFYVTEGKVHEEIVKYAKNNKMSMIIMARRGAGMIEHILLGSNAERVAATADCPVLTV